MTVHVTEYLVYLGHIRVERYLDAVRVVSVAVARAGCEAVAALKVGVRRVDIIAARNVGQLDLAVARLVDNLKDDVVVFGVDYIQCAKVLCARVYAGLDEVGLVYDRGGVRSRQGEYRAAVFGGKRTFTKAEREFGLELARAVRHKAERRKILFFNRLSNLNLLRAEHQPSRLSRGQRGYRDVVRFVHTERCGEFVGVEPDVRAGESPFCHTVVGFQYIESG